MEHSGIDPNKPMQCLSVMPILPSTDIARTEHFYQLLGFATRRRSDVFIITRRDAIELSFSLKLQHDPKVTAGCVYVRVTDADALHELWKGIGGVKEPRDQDYGMRDLPVIDPDGNLILFGSPLPV